MAFPQAAEPIIGLPVAFDAIAITVGALSGALHATRRELSVVGHLFTVARDLARSEGIAEDGYRLIINCNRNGGQEVYHLHVHLVGGAPLGPMVAR